MLRTLRAAGACLALAAALLATIPTTASAAPETVTVTDTLGRTVTVPHGAKRVLLGFYFEDFYAIVGPDAFKRVVAISRDTWEGWRNLQWKAYSAVEPRIEKIVDVGEVESGTFNLEAALVAKPDVAIVAAWQFRAMGNAVDKLEKAGIPVVAADFNAQTLEKHLASARLIGAVMATEDRAEQLASEYENAFKDVLARVANATGPKKRVYVELARKGASEYDNSYAGRMWGGVIDLVGGDNIANGQITNWGALSPEYVLASKPEMVLLAGSGWAGRDQAVLMGFGVDENETQARARAYRSRPGWAELPAIRNKEIYAVYHGGARTLYDYTFLQFIAKALHPEAFADIDPQENHRRFYERWLPVKASGSFMLKVD
ncbi:ABC transporter substrate-binding protein [Nisaea sp.]|uniref:ABC transporter substrate-binding protein n=1 Tax=Nisaea sp. TaxID=2024842 RepID=UPI0032989898